MTTPTPKLYASIKNHKMIFHDPAAFGARLNKFEEGQELEVTIKKRFKLRTSGQPGEETNFNGYYWGVVVQMIADHCGYFEKDEIEQLHCWIQTEVNNVVRMPNGTTVPRGTSRLSGAEFSDYCSKVRTWASSHLNMYIPEPHECVYGS